MESQEQIARYNEFINRGEFPFNYEQKLVDNERDVLEDILNGIQRPPLHFEFLPTEKCNNACVWCVGGPRKDMSSNNELSEKVMKKVLGELKDYGMKGIVRFSGMSGEPLMNSGTLPAIKHGVDLGLDIGIITNGILLDNNSHNYLRGVKYLSVSLDAATKKTFDIVKGHNDRTFYDIVDNIERMVGFRKRNNERSRMGISFMLHSKNYHEIMKATRLAKNTGVDFIQFKVPHNKENDFTDSQVEEIYEQLRQAGGYSDEGFRVMPMQTISEGRNELKGVFEDLRFKRCYSQYLNSVIGAEGNVYPCVHYPYHSRTISGKPIGNVYRRSFPEIWEGEKRKAFLEKINPSEDCKFCNRYDTRINKFINFLAKNPEVLD